MKDFKINVEDVEKYFASVNLGDFDLGGCQFSQEDYEMILKRMEESGRGMDEVVEEFLFETRDTLDEGLEDEIEDGLDDDLDDDLEAAMPTWLKDKILEAERQKNEAADKPVPHEVER